MDLVFMIIGMIAVLWGADRFTEGAGALALKMNVPQIVVGLTIVAFGTSAPELCVSLFSALKGSSGLAIGNIIGSNIFNTTAIIGSAALVAPIAIRKSTVRKDIPFTIGASVLFMIICLISNCISRLVATLLLTGFIIFMVYTFMLAKRGRIDDDSVSRKQQYHSVLKCIIFIIVGLGCLIAGSNIFVDGAAGIAKSIRISDAVVGLTVVACGTGLPELATSIVAARKGQSGIAIGNVVGSNIFNILFILGVTGIVHPLPTAGITFVDSGVMTGSIILLWRMSYTKYRIERWEGAVLVVLFTAYICWLAVNA